MVGTSEKKKKTKTRTKEKENVAMNEKVTKDLSGQKVQFGDKELV